MLHKMFMEILLHKEKTTEKQVPVEAQECMPPFELAQQQICSFLFPTVRKYNNHSKLKTHEFVALAQPKVSLNSSPPI